MPNRLIHAISPYLLQHAHNPVDWYPWGDEAFEKSKREDKPIFLSIGYASCHWCHVMAHESFEDENIAAILNAHFVNIKVDREEHPEIDEIYMNAVVALTGQGGWPLSVFLTPELKPFYGGTYFPAQRRFNLPSFRELLEAIVHLWRHDRQQVLESGEKILAHLKKNFISKQEGFELTPQILDEAVLKLAQGFDWQNGGWGSAPKFPHPMVIEFLLHRAYRGDKFALDMAQRTLEAMARGGMYDLLGGGFARYSTDNFWTIPHFEKMLYDNALLARNYLHAFLLTKNDAFKQVAQETLDFIQRELTSQGEFDGVYSSLDADSEGIEGKYYLWTLDEIKTVLREAQRSADFKTDFDWFDFFCHAFHSGDEVHCSEGMVIRRKTPLPDLMQSFHISADEATALLYYIRCALLERRSTRVRPGVDDKVLVSWCGLALISFVEAGRFLGVNDYAKFAQKLANFILDHMFIDGKLLRVYRKGAARHNATLSDYASLALGLLSLYQLDFDTRWYQIAREMTDSFVQIFYKPGYGFYDTEAERPDLIMRPAQIQDLSIPSGGSLAALCLTLLSSLSGRQEYRLMAENSLPMVQSYLNYPTAIGHWLCVMDVLTHAFYEVALIGERSHAEFENMLSVINARYRPDLILAASPYPAEESAPELVQNRPMVSGTPTAYVCHHFVCKAPLNHAYDLQMMLDGDRKSL